MNLVHAVWEPSGNGPFPTIVAMHGWGSNALDLVGLAPFVADGRFLFICPQGPEPVEIGAVNGYGWYPRTRSGHPDREKASDDSAAALKEFIDRACVRYPVDSRKLVALGFSQGGAMAYNLAMRWPGRFAALVAISTTFPAAFAERVTPDEALERLPTLVQHGRSDQMIEIAQARQAVELLRKLKVPLVYREYGCGHEITAEGIRDLSSFLIDKVAEPIIRV